MRSDSGGALVRGTMLAIASHASIAPISHDAHILDSTFRGRAPAERRTLHPGECGRQLRALGGADCGGAVVALAGLGGRRAAYVVRLDRRWHRLHCQPQQPQGTGRRPPVRPRALRERRVAGAGVAAGRGGCGHDLGCGGEPALAAGAGAGAWSGASGGVDRAGGQGGALSLHAGHGQAHQLTHADCKCVACAFRRGVVVGGGRRRGGQPDGLSLARPGGRLRCRVDDWPCGRALWLGSAQ